MKRWALSLMATCVKLHSGEPGNQNFLRPDFMKPAVDRVGGTIVECNTAYDGQRDTTDAHRKTMQLHGWVEIADVDIMDAEGEMTIPVVGGKHLDKNYVGKTFPKYDSMLVLSHFKGHPMGGYGGALKNISIGIASSYGKNISTALRTPRTTGTQTTTASLSVWRMPRRA